MSSTERCWDTEPVGHGIADGSAIKPDAERFLAILTSSLWVAEAPEVHLLPHLEQVCAVPGSPWQVIDAALDDAAVYQVRLRWSQPDGTLHQVRAAVFTLIGSIAESVTYIHQQVVRDQVVLYDICIGMLAGDSPFKPHSHLMRLTVQRGA